MVQPAIAKHHHHKKGASPPKSCGHESGNVIYFYGNSSPLSNFHNVPGGFEHEGVTLPTSEHHMMHAKAVQNGDVERADAIQKAKTPMNAKKLGRKVAPFDQQLWGVTRQGIVTDILVSKFRVPSMKEALFSTDDKELCEASPTDCIWGIGINIAAAVRGEKHRGSNLLGKALMRARDILREEEKEA